MLANGNMKLAIFLPSLAGGGAERAMLNLAHGFAERSIKVDLVLARAQGPYLDQVGPAVRIVDLKALRALASVPKLAHYLRDERPAALISALDYANVVALWARRLANVPTKILVNEQNTISRSATSSARRRQRLVPYLVRLFYPWADHIVGNSHGVAEDLGRVTRLPQSRIRILYNPVVTAELRDKAHAQPDHAWFTPGQPPVVLAVGRLTRQKDFPTLLKAFARVLSTRSARLMILGEGPDRVELEKLISELGIGESVAMPGFVNNPYAFMSRAALYVLSSRWEGLPTVLIEALYCGPSVIATDCPSGPREILDSGRHGALVPVGDVPALAEAITRGLEGGIPAPTAQSWHPYSSEAVVNEYIGYLSNGRE